MQVTDNTPTIITRTMYYDRRWWTCGVMVKRGSIIHASWPDNARHVYSLSERPR